MFNWLSKTLLGQRSRQQVERRNPPAKLPPRQGESYLSPLPGTHDYDDAIAKAVKIIRDMPDVDNLDLCRRLASLEMDRSAVARLVEFIPLVYARLFLLNEGPRFSDEFLQVQADGTLSSTKPLFCEPIWVAIVHFAKLEFEQKVSRSEIDKLANRSSEMEAWQFFQKQGYKPRDLAFSPPVFCWPEESQALGMPSGMIKSLITALDLKTGDMKKASLGS